MAATGIPSWELLPIPALEAIFRHLCVSQLIDLRLLCRRWNSAICQSPKLMGYFWPCFYGDQTVFRTASLDEQQGMVELSTARFREALVDAANIGPMAVSPLWARIGQSIRSLEVSCERDEELSVGELLQMLWVLPNLRSLRLEITSSKVKFDTDDGIKLDQLETLDITGCGSRLIELFSKICSNLKTLKYRGKMPAFCIYGMGLAQPNTALPIICANYNSLRKISLKNIKPKPGTWMEQIPAAIRLQLKELTLDFGYFDHSVKKRDLLKLCKAFPAVETLKIKLALVDPKYLEDLRKNLKQLRNLTISLKRDNTNQSSDLKAFLEKSPQLENLSVNFGGQANPYNEKEWIDLRGLACPNLRKLTFRKFSYSPEELDGFFRSCSNVTHLCLNEIFTFVMHDALLILRRLKSLVFLEVFVQVTPYNNEENFYNFDGTDLLSVRTVRTNCLAIARCCPNSDVVKLYYDSCVQFCENGILETLESFPKVMQLFMSYRNNRSNNIDEDLYVIAAHGKKLTNLRKVHLEIKRNTATKVARDALTAALQNIADVQIEIIKYLW